MKALSRPAVNFSLRFSTENGVIELKAGSLVTVIQETGQNMDTKVERCFYFLEIQGNNLLCILREFQEKYSIHFRYISFFIVDTTIENKHIYFKRELLSYLNL